MKAAHLYGLASALLLSIGAFAQVPSGAPVDSTGMCNDGSYTSNPTRKGACSGHGGLKDWYRAETNLGKSPGNTNRANRGKTLTPAGAPNAPEAPSEPGEATTPMKKG